MHALVSLYALAPCVAIVCALIRGLIRLIKSGKRAGGRP